MSGVGTNVAENQIWRVLIADDHPVSSEGVAHLLARDSRYQVLGTATDGARALAMCRELEPDLLVLDLVLPKISGLLVFQELLKWPRRPRTIVMSGLASGMEFHGIAQMGVEGLVSKEDRPEVLLEALAAVRSGGRYTSATISSLTEPLTGKGEPGGWRDFHALTGREREVLGLVAQGCSNDEIGQHLGIAGKTAKKHRENIRNKLGVTNAVEAARVAARLGLVKL
jgi:DNA-binding NarL/FixJ family response regulator